MTPDEKVRLGQAAAYLLDNEVFAQAMDACLVHCQMRWASTEPDDPASREILFQQFTAVHSIEEMLKNFIEDGTRAERENDGD